MRRDGAEVLSTRWQSSLVNLRQTLLVGAWNVLSLREDDHLYLLSSELQHLDIDMAALSEVRRHDGGETMVGVYTSFWSGHFDF